GALRQHTEGLPLFVANVVDELVALGALARDRGGAWSMAPDTLSQLQVPETIAGIIEKHLARAPAELSELLEAASILGSEFTLGVLAQLLERSADELQGQCEAHVRSARWLQAAGITTLPNGQLVGRYAFRHALYRRVLYQRLAAGRRLQFH